MCNFEGTYEIIGANGPCGSLEVSKKGLYTLFCAQTEPLDGVQRLAVGDHETEYMLGVLMPSGEGCTLRRLLSASQLKQTGLESIKSVHILGVNCCPVPQQACSLPLNIGGEFACPENFVKLQVEDREDGLYGIMESL